MELKVYTEVELKCLEERIFSEQLTIEVIVDFIKGVEMKYLKKIPPNPITSDLKGARSLLRNCTDDVNNYFGSQLLMPRLKQVHGNPCIGQGLQLDLREFILLREQGSKKPTLRKRIVGFLEKLALVADIRDQKRYNELKSSKYPHVFSKFRYLKWGALGFNFFSSEAALPGKDEEPGEPFAAWASLNHAALPDTLTKRVGTFMDNDEKMFFYRYY